jgi:hypothetical protein
MRRRLPRPLSRPAGQHVGRERLATGAPGRNDGGQHLPDLRQLRGRVGTTVAGPPCSDSNSGRNGTSVAASTARPSSTGSPRSAAASASSLTGRDLPMPASPRNAMATPSPAPTAPTGHVGRVCGTPRAAPSAMGEGGTCGPRRPCERRRREHANLRDEAATSVDRDTRTTCPASSRRRAGRRRRQPPSSAFGVPSTRPSRTVRRLVRRM